MEKFCILHGCFLFTYTTMQLIQEINHFCSIVFLIMIRAKSITCITTLSDQFISHNHKFCFRRLLPKKFYLQIITIRNRWEYIRLFILDKLRFEPEKLCAWLRFASYTSWKGLHFCRRTLINLSQLQFQWVIDFWTLQSIQYHVTISYHFYKRKYLLYKIWIIGLHHFYKI